MSILLIAPQDQQAWLVGPGHEAASDGVPLCASHADRVTVPFGWQLRDDRPAARPRSRRKSRSRKTVQDPPAAAEPSGAAAEPQVSTAPEPVETALAPETAERTASTAAVRAVPEPAAVPTVEPSALDAPVPSPTAADAVTGTSAAAESSGPDRGRSPAEVPLDADEVATAVAGSTARLTVVPGDDDPSKTFTVEPDGQTALWAETQRDDNEPSDETPLLKRAFRVVRED